MVSEGDDAPDFTAPLANGDVTSFTLSDHVGDGPVVLAFFPGAFTSVCSHEMAAFRDRLDEVHEAGGSLFGVSVDLPFALNEFREELGLEFDIVSDTTREVVDAYGIPMNFEELGVNDVAKRSVFVIDDEGTITYAWVSDDPGVEPDYDEVLAAVEEAA
jgi:peroxiredoxin